MSSLCRTKILLADDDRDCLDALNFVFLGLPLFEIVCAQSGMDALNLLHQSPFDLIISDVQMPNGSGPWLLEQLKVANIRIPLIFTSGGFSIDDDSARFLGAAAFFPKPSPPATVLNLVNKILAKRAA